MWKICASATCTGNCVLYVKEMVVWDMEEKLLHERRRMRKEKKGIEILT